MCTKRFLAAGCRIFVPAILGALAIAQAQVYDVVNVKLPYQVTVNNKVLQPGEYRIRELPGATKSPVIQIFGDDGMKFETSVMSIPALKTETPEKTSLVLHHIGKDYYFDKMWVQGENYGYEFPLPSDVQSRMREASAKVNVPATVAKANLPPAPPPPPTVASTSPTTESNSANLNASQNSSATTAPSTAQQPEVMAQNRAPQMATQTPANAGTPSTEKMPETMPKTSANWALALLSGGLLLGAGLTLRRRRLL
jgi:hypothetical protein